MIGLGLVLSWVSVFLIPVAARLGVSEHLAQRLPFAGLILGLAWGLLTHVSRNATGLLSYLAGTVVLGAVFWCIGLLVGGLLVMFDVAPRLADLIPVAGFCIGTALGVVVAFAPIADWLCQWRGRHRG